MEILRVENVTKVYGTDAAQVRSLDGVSLSVERGEFVAIVGASGSGKSTLLHILGAVDRPTSGSVFVNGEEVFTRSDERLAVFRRREVGIIYQFFNLVPVLDVLENIELPILLDGRTPDEAAVARLVDTLGLTGRERNLPNQLSGGQQQRVSIGRALANNPSIVLADEPTGNLDSRNSAEIESLLRRSNAELGQTLIMVTHDQNIALQADRVISIADGRIASDERVR